MNFNSATSPSVSPKPKNNNKLVAEIIIAVVLGTFGAIGIWHYVMETSHIVPSSEGITPTHSDLQQKLFDKCQKLQNWYQSLDGFENTNYHCDKYVEAWSGLVK